VKEALLYEKLDNHRVRCQLCHHFCLIQEGKRGVCRVRQNINGVLYTLVYGKVIAAHIDPVEKKPLFHFFPGSFAYSIATLGCNFHCQWCQNWEISQAFPEKGGEEIGAQEIVALAQEGGCRSIAYTYTEPTIFFEYSYDIARLAKRAGMRNLYISNGYMSRRMLEMLSPYLDAVNIDLKSLREEVYTHYIGGHLQPVLENLRQMRKMGIWVEVTTLIISGINDTSEELREIARFIVNELGEDTPWHLSRFFPAYKMNREITPLSSLERAREIGLELGLRYVYEGNIPDDEAVNTYCPNCQRLLIRRQGFSVIENLIHRSECPYCHFKIAGVGLG